MTSKEALERLKDDIEINYLSTKHSNEKDKSNYLILLNSIEKDLEILDIFKSKNVDIKLIKELAKGKIMFDHYSYDYLTDEEYGKIKEWLEE